MLNASFNRLCRRAALTGGCCAAISGMAAAQVVTNHFQNGANDYTGTFDHQISENAGEEIDLNTVASYFMDGLNSAGSSPDRQILMRFDDIIGDGPGQIPSGATILDAELVVTTSVRGNAQTGGPWGVSGLLQAFDSATSYFVDFTTTTDMGSRGAWWMDGSATRPVGGYGFQTPGTPDSANVIPLVQSWVNGSQNYGLVIQAGLSDALGVAANTSEVGPFAPPAIPWSIRAPSWRFLTRPLPSR